MTNRAKIRPARQRELLLEGMATINIDQSMRLARRMALSGSIKSDWIKVGQDIAGAIREVRRESEAA